MSKPKQTEGKPKEWDLNDVLSFGKHKGLTVIEAMNDDPNWFHWALAEIPWFVLSNRAFQKLPPYREADPNDDLSHDAWGDREY